MTRWHPACNRQRRLDRHSVRQTRRGRDSPTLPRRLCTFTQHSRFPIGAVSPPNRNIKAVKPSMHLKDEITVLDQHRRTTQLVIANLVAALERLSALPEDPKRERLLELQQEALEAARESLELPESALEHLRSVEALYVGAA
jgi:hypothetical protein